VPLSREPRFSAPLLFHLWERWSQIDYRRATETGYSRSLGPTVAPIIAPLAALNLGSLFGSTFSKGGYIYI